MATLGPQIVTGSYGNLLKFLPTGEDGVTLPKYKLLMVKVNKPPYF
jgi:hypothetical protein